MKDARRKPSPPQPNPLAPQPRVGLWKDFRLQAIILTLLSFALYGATFILPFGYALDDGLVIKENPYTTSGVAGIPDILTKDTYQWFYDKHGSRGELEGGRWRPLSAVTFAVEYELFGLQPRISHFFNVAIYALTLLLLLYLLHFNWLRKQPGLAFLIVLLFAIHPIHSEAVANIKGRDELLSMLFLVLAILGATRYVERPSPGLLVGTGLAYLLALLAKENGITFLAVVPLALWLFTGAGMQRRVTATAVFAAVAVLFLALRFAVLGNPPGGEGDILNNPFLYATFSERYGTALYVLLQYARMMVWPWPLSFDYGFAHFAYRGLGDPLVLLSVALHTAGLVWAVLKIRKHPVPAFGILFYLFTLSIVSNLAINIGATMGERLAYLSSFGAMMALGWLLWQGLKKFSPGGRLVVLVSILALAGYATVARTLEWKDNRTLFLADVSKVPNSIKANSAAANEYLQLFVATGDTINLHMGRHHYERVIALYPQRAEDARKRELFIFDSYINLGYVHYMLGNLEQAEQYLTPAKAIKPFHPKIAEYEKGLAFLYLRKGLAAGLTSLEDAVHYFRKATQFDPGLAEAWYNLGGASFTLRRYDVAKEAFERTLALEPTHEQARQGLEAVLGMLN